MSSNNSSRSGGMGLGTILTIIFVVLKLVNVQPVASWSWLWVLSPLWIGFLLTVALLVIAGVVLGAAKSAGRARSRSTGPSFPRNDRERYARIAERAQQDQFRNRNTASVLSTFDQRNGIR